MKSKINKPPSFSGLASNLKRINWFSKSLVMSIKIISIFFFIIVHKILSKNRRDILLSFLHISLKAELKYSNNFLL